MAIDVDLTTQGGEDVPDWSPWGPPHTHTLSGGGRGGESFGVGPRSCSANGLTGEESESHRGGARHPRRDRRGLSSLPALEPHWLQLGGGRNERERRRWDFSRRT